MRVMVEKAFGPAARSSVLQVSHMQTAASGAALRIKRTNVSGVLSTVRGHSHYCPAVTPTHPVLIHLTLQPNPAWIPRPGSHQAAGTVAALSFSHPQCKPQPQGHET